MTSSGHLATAGYWKITKARGDQLVVLRVRIGAPGAQRCFGCASAPPSAQRCSGLRTSAPSAQRCSGYASMPGAQRYSGCASVPQVLNDAPDTPQTRTSAPSAQRSRADKPQRLSITSPITPFMTFTSNSLRHPHQARYLHDNSVPYSGPPSYMTLARRFSPEPDVVAAVMNRGNRF